MKALLTQKNGDGFTTQLKQATLDNAAGEVTVRVEWSTVNYKDALALSGLASIMQRLPQVGGIDLAGVVESSDVDAYRAGDRVLVTGWGLSQSHDGGYAEYARVPADWLIPVPAAFSTRDSMAIGTAGLTAMLCVLALEAGGMAPDRGDVLVTGANGGVGSVAITLLSELGYRVVASTGRLEETQYLSDLGASEVIDRRTLSSPSSSPLGPERWAAAIDTVGSHTLANVLGQIRYGGVVAACGLAQGLDLPGSVVPFIARAVTLAGVDSVNAPAALRLKAWARLANELDLSKLAPAIREIELGEVPAMVPDLLAGKIRGRTVVRIS